MLTENELELAKQAIGRIEEMRQEGKPYVTMFACEAEALLDLMRVLRNPSNGVGYIPGMSND